VAKCMGTADLKGWDQLAPHLLTVTLGLKAGQSVAIASWRYTSPVAEVLAFYARRLKISPLIFLLSDTDFVHPVGSREGTEANLLSSLERLAASACDGFVLFPPLELTRRHDRFVGPLSGPKFADWSSAWAQALGERAIPGVCVFAGAVSRRAARSLHVDFGQWRTEYVEGSLVSPRLLRRYSQRVVELLQRGRTLQLSHRNGTRLTVALTGVNPHVEDGQISLVDRRSGRNWIALPAGEVIIALAASAVEGRFVANVPAWHFRGVIRGMDWRFHDGRLLGHTLRTGKATFEEARARAGKTRDRAALLSIGLNPRSHECPFLEDRGAGNVTLYLGHNDDYGGDIPGRYREFATLRGGKIAIDGEAVPVGYRA
jgi:hypothetical protein